MQSAKSALSSPNSCGAAGARPTGAERVLRARFRPISRPENTLGEAQRRSSRSLYQPATRETRA
ncbi:hypothetical protein BST29_02475 [Mycobacterium malmoense]|uniref:Uncharacterized protein n=1 Tax=Mycobacterium malmoense TaxID=1780 RepID=A0ABX3SXC8_MYCMA|nr:hypothetical protein BST29_02475 [Mycobacterium malmoense]